MQKVDSAFVQSEVTPASQTARQFDLVCGSAKKRTIYRKMLRLCAAAIVAAHLPCAYAEDYPTHVVKVIVPYAPGGPTDTFAREIASGLGAAFKESVVVENVPGASGNLGMQRSQRMDPDGYTLTVVSAAQAVNMTLYEKPGYDLSGKFTLVSLIGVVPNVILAYPGLHVETMQQMIDYARKHPGELEYGAGGYGGSAQLSGSILEKMTGIRLNYINYKGAGPAYDDFLGGHIRIVVADLPAALPFISSKRAIPLGVTSPQRSEYLPNVPAVSELLPGYQSVAWFALLAPRQAPASVIEKLRTTSETVMGDPRIKAQLKATGASRPVMTDVQKDAFLSDEVARWKTVVEQANIPRIDN